MPRTHARSLDPSPFLVVVLATLLIAATAALPAAEPVGVRLAPSGLDDLGPGWAYEGWLIVDGQPVSTGTFTVDSNGMPSRTDFSAMVSDAAGIGAFVLTIEPAPDPDPAPSHVHLLGGAFSGGHASATIAHPAALGDTFASASGSFILAAPSAGMGGDYRNGIWWLDPSIPAPTLSLPTLPDGWVYEGWVAGPDGPVSTGRFTMVSGADSDGGGLMSGPNATPQFPGQDFVTTPRDLTSGYAAVISIEPEPDNSPGPFTLKPLVAANIMDAGMGVQQPMALNPASFPSLQATLLMPPATATVANLRVNFHGLEDLGPDFVYEGWLIVDGAPVSTGTFTVSGGVPSQSTFTAAVSDLGAVSKFVLTIEPASDPDPAPSHVHLLGGDFVSHAARLSVADGAALGTDFSAATGSYVLAAPSAGMGGDYRNGIWWLDPSVPAPALSLPTLPDGWVYEGWVAGPDGPVSTGRFTMTSGADSDGGSPAAGPNPTPPFPGSDFVNPPFDLTSGYAAVISVEPEPDNSPGPFLLKPLLDPVIDDVGEKILQPMHRNPASLPWGTAIVLDQQMVLAAAATDGANGSKWTSMLDLQNTTPWPMPVRIELLRGGQANPSPMGVDMMLPAWGATHIDDVLPTLFGTMGTGALRLLAPMGALVATSRIANVAGGSSFGQGITAESMANAIPFGHKGRLVGLSSSSNPASGSRTNIGLLNPGATPIDVLLELFRADGSLVGRLAFTLGAFEQGQLNGAFAALGDADVPVGFATITTTTPGARVFGYASVINMLSGDPTWVQVQ